MSNGDLAAGLASLERASALDPRSLVIAENHAWTLLTLGRNADAKPACMRVLQFAPNYQGCLGTLAVAQLITGDYESARPLLERLAAVQNPDASGQAQALIAALTGHGDRRALALRMAALPYRSRLDATSGNALEDYQVATVLMLLGEGDLALDYMERISAELGNEIDWALMMPAMHPIRCEPRFVAIVERMHTTDPYAAKVCAGKP
jgi:tetratricopeptide (TPR) repeat protein